MQYTYEVNEKMPSGFIRLVDVFTRSVEIKPEHYTTPKFIVVCDNRSMKEIRKITSEDEYEDFMLTEERKAAWKPHEEHMEITETNLKNAAAKHKPKTSAIPPIAILKLGQAMQNGADKYERFNWRGSEVTASVFYDAMMRHLLQWYQGEDEARDSGVHHLAHLMAGAAIVLDAIWCNRLNDDRNKTTNSLIKD